MYVDTFVDNAKVMAKGQVTLCWCKNFGMLYTRFQKIFITS